MKILKITPTPFFSDRGCHIRIFEEAKALERRGHEVIICTYHNGKDIEGFDIRRTISIPWYDKTEAGPSVHMLYIDFLLLIKTLLTSIKEKPDIIHAHLHEGIAVGLLINKLLRIPMVSDLQGKLSEEMVAHEFMTRDSIAFRVIRVFEDWLERSSEHIVTSTAKAKELITGNTQSEKVSYLPDGVDSNFIEFNPDIQELQELKRKNSIPDDKLVFVYLGLLNKYQGTDILIEAISNLNSRVKEKVHFLIMGYPNVSYYSKMAKDFGISNNVTFTGRIPYEEAPIHLAMGDFSITPKIDTSEGNGKILNYMALGLPVIAFETPVNRELLGEFGIFAGYADSGKLSEVISIVAKFPGDFRGRGIQNKKRVEQNYFWLNNINKLTTIYEKLSHRLSRR